MPKLRRVDDPRTASAFCSSPEHSRANSLRPSAFRTLRDTSSPESPPGRTCSALVDEHTVKSISPVNMLALSLIALAGGAELDLASVRKGASSLVWGLALQTALVFVIVAGVFLAARPMIPFARSLPFGAAFGVALCKGVRAL